MTNSEREREMIDQAMSARGLAGAVIHTLSAWDPARRINQRRGT